jgi:hypothetical protein
MGQTLLSEMRKAYRIELDDFELGQLLDGAEARADAWEKTARHYRTGELPPDFIIEECNGADEAERIAAHYRAIIAKVRSQREAQS